MSDTSSSHDASRREFLANATMAAAVAIPAYATVAAAPAAAAAGKSAAPVVVGAEQTGTAGELHQTTSAGHPDLTTNQGVTIADDENSLKIGMRGPTSLEDFILREKINHFDHERIPERVVHARGSAAHGYFELTHSLADLSKAAIFQTVGERTPAFVRFSTVAGSKGSADLARDVRGFAVKF
jgi:catalase